LDCQACAACCRHAYDSTEVRRSEPFASTHRRLLTERMGQLHLLRNGGNCPCLAEEAGTYTCTVYADRPRTCREFEVGEANCLDARQRLGLAP
jgi:Fe-S-cluster containining protein